MREDRLGEDFGGRVLIFEADNPIAVATFKVGVGGIGRIYAEGVVESVHPGTDGVLDDLEIADHLVLVKRLSFQDELHFPGVAMGELAGIRVLGQHVSVLDIDGFADAIGHSK